MTGDGPDVPAFSGLARDIAASADTLAAAIGAFEKALSSTDDEPWRRAGFRCDTAAGSMRQAARELRETATDLDRIAAATAPGTCSVPWGVCPAHGNTLTSSGGKSWCRVPGCCRTWDYDRGGLPCAEPARWQVTDQHGASSAMCTGHQKEARQSLAGATIVPLAASRSTTDRGDGASAAAPEESRCP